MPVVLVPTYKARQFCRQLFCFRRGSPGVVDSQGLEKEHRSDPIVASLEPIARVALVGQAKIAGKTTTAGGLDRLYVKIFRCGSVP